MAKSRSTAFFCKECGYETSKWMGQCPGCGQWNTLVEAPVESSVKKGISVLTQGGQAVPVRVSQIDTESDRFNGSCRRRSGNRQVNHSFTGM